MPVKRRIAKARRRTDVNEKLWAWLSDSLPEAELRSDSEIVFQVLQLESWPDEMQSSGSKCVKIFSRSGLPIIPVRDHGCGGNSTPHADATANFRRANLLPAPAFQLG